MSPGRLEKHSVENLGDIPSEFLRVELKQVPLGFQRPDSRSAKPFDLRRSGVSVEFTSPFLKIERVIAAAGQSTAIAQSNNTALLIAFSTSTVAFNADSKVLQPGQVPWINPHQALRLSGLPAAAAHVLRIVF